MNKILTSLIALLLSTVWLAAQNKGGRIVDSQMGSYVNGNTYYPSYYGGPVPIGIGICQSADDFLVPAEGMVVYGAKALSNHGTFYANFNVYLYSDNGGIPDTVFESYSIGVWEETELEYNVYEYTFEFPYPAEMTAGRYWISIQGTGRWGTWNWLVNSDTAVSNHKAKQKDISAEPIHYYNWSDKIDSQNGNGKYNNLAFALVGAADENDLALKTITSPKSGELTANSAISVVIENTGLQTQTNFQVAYQVSTTIDGNLTLIQSASETVNVSLAYEDAYEYSFTKTANLADITTYSLKTWVSLNTDTNPGNDSYAAEVINYGELYFMGTDKEVTTCDGIFVDNGGMIGAYNELSSDTIIFYPGALGDRITLNFTLFDIGEGINVFDFYDGISTDAPILFSYSQDTDVYPTFLQARNVEGAITTVVRAYDTYNRGWAANVECVTPNAVDFKTLNILVGEPGEYFIQGKEVNVNAIVTNTGSDTISRMVYLYENETKLDSLLTDRLIPGQIDSLPFTWIPSLVADTVVLNFKIENDPQASNEDNVLETIVATYKVGTLLESFETSEMPFEWVSKTGTSAIVDNFRNNAHGKKLLKFSGSDTIVMPLTLPESNDFLKFEAAKNYSSNMQILHALNADGPWDLVGEVTCPEYYLSEFSFDISDYAGEPCYFALTQGQASQSVYTEIDNVRGAKHYYYAKDMMAISLSGNDYAKTGVEAMLHASICNIGTLSVSGQDYTIEIRSIDSIYISLAGIDLASKEFLNLQIPYVFTTVDTVFLYINIIYPDEERVDNNQSKEIQMKVIDAYVADGETTGATSVILQLNKVSSISEIVYYPTEIGLYGNLKGLEFTYNNINDEQVDTIPVSCYLATMVDSFLVDTAFGSNIPSWVGTDSINFTKVYHGKITFYEGENLSMYLPFDASFAYNGAVNLVLIVVKDSTSKQSAYPTFHTRDSEQPRFLFGSNDHNSIDLNNLENLSNSNVISNEIPNIRFHFDNPGAPEFESVPLTLIKQNEAYSYAIEVAYSGSDNYALYAKNLPAWLALEKQTDTTYLLSGIAYTIGEFPIELTITDGIYTANQRFTLTVGAVPIFISEPVVYATIGEKYVYNTVVEYNGNGLTINAITLPIWLTLTDNGDGTAKLEGTPTESNTFDVVLLADGEYFDAVQSFTISVELGIVNQNADTFSVYPNPANHWVIVSGAANTSIAFIDILGSIILVKNINTDMEKVDISTLKEGVYFISISGNYSLKNLRLMIE